MAGVNKVLLVGNLGKDVELRYTPSGTAVATFSLATSENYKDRDGNRQTKTEWHNIVAWRNVAEICGKYLKKGSQVYVEGKLQTRNYDDRDGNKRYITEIVIEKMQMLGSNNDQGGQQGGGQQQRSQPNNKQSASTGGGQSDRNGYPEFNPDDEIPF